MELDDQFLLEVEAQIYNSALQTKPEHRRDEVIYNMRRQARAEDFQMGVSLTFSATHKFLSVRSNFRFLCVALGKFKCIAMEI